MKLKSIKIKNFRGYHNETELQFDDLTALVGKNDVGKSSILEALDIFFNENKGIIKLDKDDFNKLSPDSPIVITAVFNELPTEIIIDENNITSLKEEHLLNENEELEIVKEFKSPTKVNVRIKSFHPTNVECKNLLSKKQSELQKIMEDLNIQCADNRKNALMRKAIWEHFADSLNCQTVEFDIASKEGDIKDIWSKLSLYIPVFSLFQADRKNCDGDGEVQEPLKEAVKSILKDESIASSLNEIAQKVKDSLEEVSSKTLEKLKEMNPELAASLHPKLPDISGLKWNDVFKNISITGDEDIPINKRGSGVKRLILLNFFRAEVERKNDGCNIIYAIEEPETSQHYEHQRILIESLKKLSQKNGVQVLITTHSSDMVKVIEQHNLRVILNNNGSKTIKNVEAKHLPYISLNEVNYCVYDMVSIEYHNELYGYLQAEAINENVNNGKESHFEQWLMAKGLAQTKSWIRIKNGQPQQPQPSTLQTYIRNLIHHPENTNNAMFSLDELRQSTKEMINIVDSFGI